MIRKKPAFETDDGNVYSSLEMAQRAELAKLFMAHNGRTGFTEEMAAVVAEVIVTNRAEFISILCASGRKPRTVKVKAKRKVLRPDKAGMIDLEKLGVSK